MPMHAMFKEREDDKEILIKDGKHSITLHDNYYSFLEIISSHECEQLLAGESPWRCNSILG